MCCAVRTELKGLGGVRVVRTGFFYACCTCYGYVHGGFSNFFVLLPQAQNVLKLLCVNWVPNTSPCQSMYLVPTPLPWDRISELTVTIPPACACWEVRWL